MKENLCNCAACVSKRSVKNHQIDIMDELIMKFQLLHFICRENAVPPEVERDAHITQSYWMEIRHIVRCIYRDSMNLSGN